MSEVPVPSPPSTRVALAAAALLVSGSASAASVTDMAPALRGDVRLGWDGQWEFGGLEEGAVEVGRRRLEAHSLLFRGEFSLVDGIAIWGGAEVQPLVRLDYPSATAITLDPATGDPSWLSGNPVEDRPFFQGAGLAGGWLGLAFAPYAERFGLGHTVTWRIDLGYRTAAPQTLWELTDGNRGVTTGGEAFKVSAAFSIDTGPTSPYLVVDFLGELPRVITADNGRGTAAEVSVEPGANVSVIGGIEIALVPPREDDTRLDLDLSAGFAYATTAVVPSGFLLPEVLDDTRGAAVERAPRLSAVVGLGLDLEITRWVELRNTVRARHDLPYLLETPYTTVRTGRDTLAAIVQSEIVIRIRP